MMNRCPSCEQFMPKSIPPTRNCDRCRAGFLELACVEYRGAFRLCSTLLAKYRADVAMMAWEATLPDTLLQSEFEEPVFMSWGKYMWALNEIIRLDVKAKMHELIREELFANQAMMAWEATLGDNESDLAPPDTIRLIEWYCARGKL